ncbi:MAG: glycerol-3-phosphate dehydrogenase/oxidase [Acidobacteria bacterium]|nr:MAG: glycerol-3-phosphate dehydrogenase/oxidase [Acidobacteriota bacterium]
MTRQLLLDRIAGHAEPWDLLIIGGGATGVGAAVDAATRGYDVLLLEQHDFGKGTSSRSTKLVHGGVRYLQQGNVPLVMEALKERGLLRQNAPHLVRELAFVVPNYLWWEAPFYGIGMRVYDMLAGRHGFGHSRVLTTEEVLGRIPMLEQEGLRGGVLYHDGQFDDSRLLIDLVLTAADHGGCLLNYAPVVRLRKDGAGYVNGAIFRDVETGNEHEVSARCVINATGAFSDAVRRMDDAAAPPMIAASQGVHIVLPKRFLGGDTAVMVPRTRDARVMFAIPWHDHTVVGTTDTPITDITLEPRPLPEEIDFILETASGYLTENPARSDILSVFTGIRPLVKAGDAGNTAALSREHTIQISKAGLVTIAGGKWTTYRKMAEDCVNHAATLAGLEERPCVTRDLRIHGYHPSAPQFGAYADYGAEAFALQGLVEGRPELDAVLDAGAQVRAAQVFWALRHEMARTVDDVLARRTRVLSIDARAAMRLAPAVAALMAAEMGRDESWQREQVDDFIAIAERYLPL